MKDMDSNHLNALIIFAKWPEPGKVKTRLSPPLSEQDASDLYRFMLMDTLEKTREIAGVTRMIFFDGDPERSADFRLLAPDADVIKQEGRDLGERLAHATEKAFSAGFRTVAIIGTDSPHLPVELIGEAFRLLKSESADIVFGPSEDGGYYLVAINKHCPELFRGIPWSSPATLKKSMDKAESVGLRPALLEKCFDVDNIDDLRKLRKEVSNSEAPGTLSFLSRLSAI